ncbi:MAG: hypothetical protein LBK50_00145 [Candidatus Nomurabacteria bacterium]|jgi:hypothetical protein|nr:hypothetical protein [Candidatus Nomurabacteria bacterium]
MAILSAIKAAREELASVRDRMQLSYVQSIMEYLNGFHHSCCIEEAFDDHDLPESIVGMKIESCIGDEEHTRFVCVSYLSTGAQQSTARRVNVVRELSGPNKPLKTVEAETLSIPVADIGKVFARLCEKIGDEDELRVATPLTANGQRVIEVRLR